MRDIIEVSSGTGLIVLALAACAVWFVAMVIDNCRYVAQGIRKLRTRPIPEHVPETTPQEAYVPISAVQVSYVTVGPSQGLEGAHSPSSVFA